MTFREATAEDWEKIAPVFVAEGGRLPKRGDATAAVAVDDDGNIAGFWVVQLAIHAGPLWVRPDLRGTGLWRRLHSIIDSWFGRSPGTGYYSFSGDSKVEAILTKLGYKDLGYKVWAKEAV